MLPKLTLVGAGPGDPDLISIKGMKAIASADVILYDALTHPDLLNYAKPGSLKIYVGKRAGKHHYSQDQINQLIVEYAFSHGHVVRLKGGDPFIFARGKEEMEYAGTFNIQTKAILGISSINLPGYYGIPLTRRGVNESFWVITATISNGELSTDLELAAKSDATVVVLMGLNKITEIVKFFKREFKNDLPLAVISKGSLEDHTLVLATVGSINGQLSKYKIETPAIIVIGEAVGTHEFYYEKVRNLLSVDNQTKIK